MGDSLMSGDSDSAAARKHLCGRKKGRRPKRQITSTQVVRARGGHTLQHAWLGRQLGGSFQ